MTTALCAMAPMVEARRDGRLDAREAASIERHIAGCASCRALEAGLGRLAELSRRPLRPDVSQLEHQRGRVALLRAAASASTDVERAPTFGARRSLRPRVALGAALAAAALSLVGAVQYTWGPTARPAALALKLPRPPALPASSARAEATVTASSGAGDTRFERSRVDGVDGLEQIERVALFEGAIDLQVPKLAPRARFLVTTDDAEVEVRGTRFRVEARQAHIAAVAVTEGKVEVRYQGTSTMLLPGMSWSPSMPSSLATSATSSPALASGSVSAGSPQTAPPAAGFAAPRRGVGRASVASGAPSRTTSAFADGVRLIERGDYAAAAEKLEAFSAATPGDERAEDAAFLAVVALQRAGRLDAAAVAARRYLDHYPQGRRRAEAEAIAAAR